MDVVIEQYLDFGIMRARVRLRAGRVLADAPALAHQRRDGPGVGSGTRPPARSCRASTRAGARADHRLYRRVQGGAAAPRGTAHLGERPVRRGGTRVAALDWHPPVVRQVGPGSWYGALAITLTYGAYMAEVYRSGIPASPAGRWRPRVRWEWSHGRAMRHVIVPQAVRRVIPPLLNDFIALMKDTSLVGVIALLEVVEAGRHGPSGDVQQLGAHAGCPDVPRRSPCRWHGSSIATSLAARPRLSGGWQPHRVSLVAGDPPRSRCWS